VAIAMLYYRHDPGIHKKRDFKFQKGETKMSEKSEKQTSELSMEDLEKVAGGGVNDPKTGVGVGLGGGKTGPPGTPVAPTPTPTNPTTPGT
jgi:hypothetical protein